MLVHPQVFGDERGFFLESYSQREYAKHSISLCKIIIQRVQNEYSEECISKKQSPNQNLYESYDDQSMISLLIYVQNPLPMENGKDFFFQQKIKHNFLCHKVLHMDFLCSKMELNFSTNVIIIMIQVMKDESSGMIRSSILIGRSILRYMVFQNLSLVAKINSCQIL